MLKKTHENTSTLLNANSKQSLFNANSTQTLVNANSKQTITLESQLQTLCFTPPKISHIQKSIINETENKSSQRGEGHTGL